MKLEQYLKRPIEPPAIDANRMVLKRAMEAGKPVHQERFNYYYYWGWFNKLGGKWTVHDFYLHLILNLCRKDREFAGKDKDPAGLRNAAKYLRTLIAVMEKAADALDSKAEILEGQDAETEAAD